jgi:acyl carrier protein
MECSTFFLESANLPTGALFVMTTTQYETIFQQVVALLQQHAPQPGPIQEDTELIKDLGFDSLKVMEMLHDVEDAFDITYPLNALSDLRTVKDFTVQIQTIIETS